MTRIQKNQYNHTRDNSTGRVLTWSALAISKQGIQTVFNNLFAQCQACLTAEGGHFQHLL